MGLESVRKGNRYLANVFCARATLLYIHTTLNSSSPTRWGITLNTRLLPCATYVQQSLVPGDITKTKTHTLLALMKQGTWRTLATNSFFQVNVEDTGGYGYWEEKRAELRATQSIPRACSCQVLDQSPKLPVSLAPAWFRGTLAPYKAHRTHNSAWC